MSYTYHVFFTLKGSQTNKIIKITIIILTIITCLFSLETCWVGDQHSKEDLHQGAQPIIIMFDDDT